MDPLPQHAPRADAQSRPRSARTPNDPSGHRPMATGAAATALAALSLAGSLAGPPEVSLDLDRAAGEVTVTVQGEPGDLFLLEQADGLGRWTEAFSGVSPTGTVSETVQLGAALSQFFRAASGSGVSVEAITYHGWEGAYRVSNGLAEVVVVPSISRIMQFKPAGDGAPEPFWENRNEDGRPPSTGTAWRNFGGDKVWPAPQAYFGRFTGTSWPPPQGFEQVAYAVTMNPEGDGLTMTSPVDPDYGVRVTRVIRLDRFGAEMAVETTFEQVDPVDPANATLETSVWVVTQVDHSLGTFMPVTENSIWGQTGYSLMSGSNIPAQNLSTVDGLVRVVRYPTAGFKLGSDAGAIVSVYPDLMLLMESPRVAGASYTRRERESSAQVYSNGGTSEPYLEMEFQSPQKVMAAGDTLSATVTYTLLPRGPSTAEADVLADARRALGR